MIAFLLLGVGVWLGGFPTGILFFLAGLVLDIWFWRRQVYVTKIEEKEEFSFYWNAYPLMLKIISAGGGLSSIQMEYLEFLLNYRNLRRLTPREREKIRQRLLNLSSSGLSFRELLRTISQGNYETEQIDWLQASLTRLINLKKHPSPETLLYFEQFREVLRREGEREKPSVCLLDIYGILGCSNFSSNDEIKQKFRRLAKLYHPDTLGEELGEREIKEATDRFLNIFDAYTAIRRERNF